MTRTWRGLPNAQLAVLPSTTGAAVIERADLVQAMIPPSLDAPRAEAG